MNVVQGRNAALMVNVLGVYYYIGCEVDFSFEYTNENILRTDVNAGSFRKRRTRISDLAGSVSGVTTTSNDDKISIFYFLQEAVRRDVQQMKYVWIDDDGGIKEIECRMLIRTINITGPQGDFSKFEMTLDHAGEGFSIDPVLPPDPSSDEGLDTDYWELAEGATTISGTGVGGKSFANKTLMVVARETDVYTPQSPLVDTTSYDYDGTTITFINPGNPGPEKVVIVWHD